MTLPDFSHQQFGNTYQSTNFHETMVFSWFLPLWIYPTMETRINPLSGNTYSWWFRNPAPPGMYKTYQNLVNNEISTTNLNWWPYRISAINSMETPINQPMFMKPWFFLWFLPLWIYPTYWKHLSTNQFSQVDFPPDIFRQVIVMCASCWWPGSLVNRGQHDTFLIFQNRQIQLRRFKMMKKILEF